MSVAALNAIAGYGVGEAAAAGDAAGDAAAAGAGELCAWSVEVRAPSIAIEATAASNRTMEVVVFIIVLLLVWRPERAVSLN